ncbi:Uncharacterised protein [Mycobacterium tuberculosis]|uniref:Uncharacterized protein n=1 Tax=Mycobacterium tuberculosis TaxID=1773 RepID=A0A916LF09_MYCTX|nr:Uncharacterised protein [Mycobacterium tuberculosis]
MKLLERCSPEVRRKRSTSGMSGRCRWRAIVDSVIRSGLSLPAATSRAISRVASVISVRPP